jgi:hypothetical protein
MAGRASWAAAVRLSSLRGDDLAQAAMPTQLGKRGRPAAGRARVLRPGLWVERLRFENPLEVVLGGALSVLVFRLIIVVRDWKTEQRARNAQASALEATASQAHQIAERRRLKTCSLSNW